MRKTLKFLALLATLLTSQALAEVTITNNFTPNTIPANQNTTYNFTISSTETVPLTNLGLAQTLNGIQSADLSKATSTCGGTLSANGNTLTWSGASLGAAPAVGNISCTVSVPVTATSNSGRTYTSTISAGAVTNNQNLSNRFQSATSLTVSAAQNLLIGSQHVDPLVGQEAKYIYNGLNTNEPVNIILYNPNDIALDFDKVSVSTGLPANITSASLLNDCNATQVSPQGSNFTITAPHFNAKSTCTVQVILPPSAPNYTNDYDYYPGTPKKPQNYLNYLTGIAVQDNNLSNKSEDISNARYTPNNEYISILTATPAITLSTAFKSNKTVTIGGDTDQTVDIDYAIHNNVLANQSISFSNPLPTWFDLSNSTVTLGAGSLSTCTTNGISIDANNHTINFNQVNLPAISDPNFHIDRALCIFQISSTVHAGSFNGTYTNIIKNSQISTSLIPTASNPNTEASRATITVQNTGNMSLDGSFYEYGIGYNTVTLNNTLNTDINGIQFDLNTTNINNNSNLGTNIAQSYSTCGGNITSTSTGFHFSGATVASGKSCKIIFAYNPSDITISNKTSTISNLTSSSGQTFSGNLTKPFTPNINLIVNQNYNSNQETVATNSKYNLTSNLYNGVLRDIDTALTLDIGPNTKIADDIKIVCDKKTIIVPQNTITRVNTNEVRFTFTLPAYQPSSSQRIDEVSNYGGCSITAPISNSVAETNNTYHYYVATQDQNNPVATKSWYYTRVTWVDSPKYTINLSYSPQQFYAGTKTTLTLNKPVAVNSINNSPFRIPIQLPEGLEVDSDFLKANSYPGNNGWSLIPQYFYGGVDINCENTQTCQAVVFVSPDHKNLIYYPVSGYDNNSTSNLILTATRFGDLTTTIHANEVQALPNGNTAQIVNDASASVKVIPAVVNRIYYPEKNVYGSQTTTLNAFIANANPTADTLSIKIHHPYQLPPTGKVTGCPGNLTSSYDVNSHIQTISGITLGSNENCTLITEVKATPVTTLTNVISYTNPGEVKTQNSNTSNQSWNSTSINILPLSVCLNTTDTNLSSTLTTPGSTTLTQTFTNNGTGTISSSNGPTWQNTLPDNFTGSFSFGSSAAANTVQQAWSNYIASNTLESGKTVTLSSTYTAAAGLSPDTEQQASISAQAPGCTSSSTQKLTLVQGKPQISKIQALCTVSNGQLQCDADTTNGLNAKPCDVVRYTLKASNSGSGPIRQPIMTDTLDSHLTLLKTSAVSSGQKTVLYSSDKTNWNASPSNTTAYYGQDSNTDGKIDSNDILAPQESLTATIYAQVIGQSCTIPTLP